MIDSLGKPASKRDLKYLSFFKEKHYLEELHQEKNDLFSLYFIKTIAAFEYYFKNIFEIVFYTYRSLFNTEEGLFKFERMPFEKQINLLRLKKISFPSIKLRTDRAVEFIATRNILLHNNGLVDDYYLNRVKNSNRKKGEIITIDFCYLKKAISVFSDFARSIDDVLAKKIFKIKFIPIINNSREKPKIIECIERKKRRTLMKYVHYLEKKSFKM